MQDTDRDGPITPISMERYQELGPVPEYTRPDGVQVKVVPHDVYIHQQKLIAQARKRRKLAEASKRKGRRK